MDIETSILLMLALALCVALIGPGLITIEDTRGKKPCQAQETIDITQQE
jgi:hypothetical protein